jgi:molybdopterin-guanine dinucleotide biosynthesis protein A
VLIAVVLAGGQGRRLGGRHKPGLTLGGRTLLDRALAAVAGADRIVVVGPVTPTAHTPGPPLRWTREEPPGGGPVAALAAGLTEPTGPDTEVVLLAADLVGVTADTVARLRAALDLDPNVDGAVLRDADDHPQWLIGVWRADALRAALPAEPAGRSLRSVLRGLTVTEVPELPGESADVDTPDDLARLGGEVGEGPVAGGASQPSHW